MSTSPWRSDDPPATEARFEPTGWTVVLAAAEDPDSPKAVAALERLCQIYWRPVYAFLRRQGHSPHDAEDLVQGFFVFVLEKQPLRKVRPEKGKFRTFLLAALQNYVADQWDKARATKRGGGIKFVPIDFQNEEARYSLEPVDRHDPEQAYHRRWAQTLMSAAISELETDYGTREKAVLYSELNQFLFDKKGEVSRLDLAQRLGVATATIDVEIFRLKRKFGHLLRQKVAETVRTTSEVESEMRQLFEAFQS